MFVENSPDSHKPVEISDLRAQGDLRSGEGKGVQNAPPGPCRAAERLGKGFVSLVCEPNPPGRGPIVARHTSDRRPQ